MTYYNQTIQHGDKVTCTINGTDITDARISVNDDGRMCIVQSEEDGSTCKDMMGYKYAWCIGYVDDPRLMEKRVTNFRILKRADGLPIFMVGDIIEDRHGNTFSVLAIMGDTFVRSDCNDDHIVMDSHTFKEAQKAGWRRVDAPEDTVDDKTTEAMELLKKNGYKVIKE